ncbi:MAG: hypothetical protein ACRD4C_05715 [Candidatus Acidiferrales bacterium]
MKIIGHPRFRAVRPAGQKISSAAISSSATRSAEMARQHRLERQFVGLGGQAKSYACFNIHELAFVIHDGSDFVELVVERQEMARGWKWRNGP